MNQLAKERIGMSKCTRLVKDLLIQKLLVSTKSEMTVILHPGEGEGGRY